MAYTFEDALKAEGATGHFADTTRSIFQQENGGRMTNPKKTLDTKVEGVMQMLPATFASVADKGWDINNPEHNARAGIRYAKQMYDRAGGDASLTAAGYYGGPGGLEKARKGIAVSDPRNPNAPNTLQYGQQVASRIKGSPVQLAQTPEVQAIAPAQVVARELPSLTSASVPVAQMPTDMEWRQLQQAMPAKPVQAADLDYENQMSMGQPQFNIPRAMPAQVVQPNFSRFKGWMGRA